MYETLGNHMMVDVAGCNVDKLNDVDFLNGLLDEIVSRTNLTVLNKFSHKFEPQGVTSAYVLSESHLTVHTFPEVNEGSAAFCIYTCGDFSDFSMVQELIVDSLEANHHMCFIKSRGVNN